MIGVLIALQVARRRSASEVDLQPLGVAERRRPAKSTGPVRGDWISPCCGTMRPCERRQPRRLMVCSHGSIPVDTISRRLRLSPALEALWQRLGNHGTIYTLQHPP